MENPGGVSWSNNPSFPLKASVSKPEGEAWVAMTPKPPTPKGLHFGVTGYVYVRPLRGRRWGTNAPERAAGKKVRYII